MKGANDPMNAADYNNLLAPGWTDYSTLIAWTSSGTAPAFGTSAKVARYRRPTDSDLVHLHIKLTFAGATFGTGDYMLSLPVTAHSEMVNTAVGTAHALDTGSASRSGIVVLDSASTLRVIVPTSGSWGAAVPHTWANTDVLGLTAAYRPA